MMQKSNHNLIKITTIDFLKVKVIIIQNEMKEASVNKIINNHCKKALLKKNLMILSKMKLIFHLI